MVKRYLSVVHISRNRVKQRKGPLVFPQWEIEQNKPYVNLLLNLNGKLVLKLTHMGLAQVVIVKMPWKLFSPLFGIIQMIKGIINMF
mmetsp:Transcript_47466/g.64619  ORF Transcript_47466/g.64619 Transcript_47466/m.64619 type:complete len:87 (+) Transcript_47466:378-638(+)